MAGLCYDVQGVSNCGMMPSFSFHQTQGLTFDFFLYFQYGGSLYDVQAVSNCGMSESSFFFIKHKGLTFDFLFERVEVFI